MILNWLLFFPALLLLFFPLDSLLFKNLKLRSLEHIDFGEGAWARKPSAWWSPSLWLDPARAFLGTWMLIHAWDLEGGAPGLLRWVPFLTTAVLLAMSTGVQMHTRRDTDALLAPTGYIAGIWFALLSPAVALLAVVVGIGGMIAFRSWSAFFLCGAVYVGVAGLWLIGRDLHVPLSTALAMLPWVISAIYHRTLMQPLRHIGHTRPVVMRDVDLSATSPDSVETEAKA